MMLLIAIILLVVGFGILTQVKGLLMKLIGAVLFTAGLLLLLSILFDDTGTTILLIAALAFIVIGGIIVNSGSKPIGAAMVIFGCFALWGVLDTPDLLGGRSGEVIDRIGTVWSRLIGEAGQTADQIDSNTG